MVDTFFPRHDSPGETARRIAEAVLRKDAQRVESRAGTLPFITISRQLGVGLSSLPQRLAETLNARLPKELSGWSAWDRELIEKVATDYQIPMRSIEQVEQFGYSWFDTFVSGLGGIPEEFAVVHRMRDAIQALAAQGRVVLVGHGSGFITRTMPGGVHVRLVAPLSYRVENYARLLHSTSYEAAKRLQQAQRHWTRFLRRYWPAQSLTPESFAVTLNTAVLEEDRVVDCIASLVV